MWNHLAQVCRCPVSIDGARFSEVVIPVMSESSPCSTFVTVGTVSLFKILGILMDVWWYLVVLIRISPLYWPFSYMYWLSFHLIYTSNKTISLLDIIHEYRNVLEAEVIHKR